MQTLGGVSRPEGLFSQQVAGGDRKLMKESEKSRLDNF